MQRINKRGGNVFLLGTIANTLAIILGSIIGLILGRIPDRMRIAVLQGLGLFVVTLGLSMALGGLKNPLITIISMVIGTVLGAWWHIEKKIETLGDWIETKTKGKYGKLSEAFVFASLIFGVGSMAIVGAIQSGVSGINSILYTKSMLDGFSAIVFTSAMGPGVAISAIPILIYEGGIATLAHVFSSRLDSPVIIADITAVGGLLIAGIGINILEIKKIQIANMLPSLIVVAIIQWFLLHGQGVLSAILH